MTPADTNAAKQEGQNVVSPSAYQAAFVRVLSKDQIAAGCMRRALQDTRRRMYGRRQHSAWCGYQCQEDPAITVSHGGFRYTDDERGAGRRRSPAIHSGDAQQPLQRLTGIRKSGRLKPCVVSRFFAPRQSEHQQTQVHRLDQRGIGYLRRNPVGHKAQLERSSWWS